MTEFYDIVDIIKDSLRNSNNINTVTFGDLTDIDLDKTTIFPLAHIFVERVRHEERMLVFDMLILVADVVDYNPNQTDNDDFFNNDNLHDVLNTQLGTMNELISSLRRGTLYQDKYQLSSTPTIEPFKERFSNLLAGWEASISIEVKNELKIGVCSSNSSTGSGNGNGSGGGNGNGSGGNGSVPVIDPSGSYFITLDQPFSFFVPTVADPRPTSWAVNGLPDGLTLNTATGQVTGTLTGEERLESASFTATNVNGTSAAKIIFFRVVTDDTTILAAPIDLRSSFFGEPVALNFGFDWFFRPYDILITESELYRDGVRSRSYVEGANGQNNIGGANITETTTPHKYKLRYIDENGSVSPFSDEFLFNWYEHTIALKYENMDLSGNIPITAPKKEYYIQKNVVDFEFDAKDIIVNNPTSFKGQSINLSIDGTVASTGSFDTSTGIMKTTFTGTVDDDFSVNRWVKGINDNGEDPEFTYIKFFFCDNDPYTFSAPDNVSVDNTDTDGKAYLTWNYLPYNTVISLVEVYNNDVLVKTIYNSFDRKYSGTGINLIDGTNVIKVRFKNENDIYSPYSEITVTGNALNEKV